MSAFFASCGKGLEYLLADELQQLGCERATAAVAGANATGTLQDAQRAVLWSRVASRVLWPLASFDCADEGALYAGAAAIDWTQHLGSGATLAVDAHLGGSGITHERFAAQRVKDAVVDTLRAATGTRPDVDVEHPDLRLHLVLRKGRATLSVDLSGGPMHRRGWRTQQGEAPLKETLAAAVLLRGQWPRVHAGGGALLDPMCGSGTLLIEGALMAADVAPGLQRHAGLPPTRWLGFDVDAWDALVQDAELRASAGRAALQPVFVGRDSDPRAVAMARENARRAGMAHVVLFDVGDVRGLDMDALNVAGISAFARHPREGGGEELRLRAIGSRDSAATTRNARGPGIEDPVTFGQGVESEEQQSRSSTELQEVEAQATSLDPRLRGDDEQRQRPVDASGIPAPGLVVCNPPYDARLAADAALYRALGDALQRVVPTWRASLLCGDDDLARATGLRAQKTYKVFNGAIEATLLACDPIARPHHSATGEAAVLSDGAQMVANRLRRNLRRLKAWRLQEGVDTFRAYDGDLPEYAAAIDVYTEADAGTRWLHVQEYAAPADIPEPLQRTRLADLAAAAREVFGVPRERVALKTRSRGRGGSKYGQFGQGGQRLLVREGAARLIANLFDYLDTGVFLDHRPMRQRLFDEARDARFLNLFAYAGAATVHAALGGARSTTSVDLSATYLQWCADNLQENGIGGTKHRLVQADALRWLASDTGQYDLVFCDPPTFSNSKRASDFDVQREHVRLLRLAVARLAPGGVLYFSNNFRRFRLDQAAVETFAHVEDISADTLPPDFERNPRIHRCWRLTAPEAGAAR
mgnify:CR=1 FL=1